MLYIPLRSIQNFICRELNAFVLRSKTVQIRIIKLHICKNSIYNLITLTFSIQASVFIQIQSIQSLLELNYPKSWRKIAFKIVFAEGLL